MQKCWSYIHDSYVCFTAKVFCMSRAIYHRNSSSWQQNPRTASHRYHPTVLRPGSDGNIRKARTWRPRSCNLVWGPVNNLHLPHCASSTTWRQHYALQILVSAVIHGRHWARMLGQYTWCTASVPRWYSRFVWSFLSVSKGFNYALKPLLVPLTRENHVLLPRLMVWQIGCVAIPMIWKGQMKGKYSRRGRVIVLINAVDGTHCPKESWDEEKLARDSWLDVWPSSLF